MGECWKQACYSKCNYLYRESKCNPGFSAKYKQQRHIVVSQLRSAKRSFVDSIPTGNTKQFWKPIKLLNGKGCSTIPVISKRQMFLITSSTVVSIPLFNIFPQRKEAFQCWIQLRVPKISTVLNRRYNYELVTNLDHKKAGISNGSKLVLYADNILLYWAVWWN